MKALPQVTLVLPCFLQLLCMCDWSCLNHCVDYVQERTGSSSLSLGCLGLCSSSRRGKFFQSLKSEILTLKMPQGGAVKWEGHSSPRGERPWEATGQLKLC